MAGVGRLRHGHATGHISPTYKSWASMVERCTNPKSRVWKHYGERGIGVDPRWLRFDDFLADMGARPPGTSLERDRNNDGYEPGNCRWATRAEQARNKRVTRLIDLNGRTQCLEDWCNELGMHSATVHRRVKRGMTYAEALVAPRIHGGGKVNRKEKAYGTVPRA